MRSMRVDGRYRILADWERLPEEVSQHETDELLDRLGNAVQEVRAILMEAYQRDDAVSDMVRILMDAADLSCNDGCEWHLDCLADEIEQMKETLAEDDDVPSYEESETVFDMGYRSERYGIDDGFYVKVIEDSDEQEVVEEIILGHGEPIYRLRTTVWEEVPGGRHSKEIRYEKLPVDEEMARLIRNTQAARREFSAGNR